MSQDWLPQIAALIGLIPISVVAVSARLPGRALFWLLLAAALVGPVAITWSHIAAGWETGLSSNLWASVAVTLAIYALVCMARPQAKLLSTLLLPYLGLLEILAIAFSNAPMPETLNMSAMTWFRAHVVLAVGSYAVLTIAAISGLSVLIQERALKRHFGPGWASRALPPLSDSEALQIALLFCSAFLMAAALATGAANEFLETGRLLAFTHKILLSFLAFALIVGLLILHRKTGLRGRRAARLLLAGYLLLTLAYPGVKFVKDVLLG